MRVQGDPLVHIIVPGYPKSCYQSLKGPRKCKMKINYKKPAKSKRIIRSNYRAMTGPLMDQGTALTLFVAYNAKTFLFSLMGPLAPPPPRGFKDFNITAELGLRMLSQDIFGSKTNFMSKSILVLKQNLRSKQILVHSKFRVQNNILSKNFGHKFFDQKQI